MERKSLVRIILQLNRNSDDQFRKQERAKLSWIINTIMAKHRGHLHYIQGYHDVCSVFLIVCDFDQYAAYTLCERVSKFHLRFSLPLFLQKVDFLQGNPATESRLRY
jgi:hypothetical protein